MKEKEERWLDGFQKGDPESFEAVYNAYSGAMYRLCYRLSGSCAEAEDLTQEAFLAAFKSRARFERRCSLSTWLYRITLDCCRAHFRRKMPRTVPLMEERAGTTPDTFDQSDDLIAIEEALKTLPKVLQESILLVKIEGLKYREAAEVLGIPTGTVQYRVFEGLQRLRTSFGIESGEAE